MPSNESYNISSLSYISKINSGFSGSFGNFTIQNKGNIQISPQFFINGSAKDIVFVRPNAVISKGLTETIEITYTIPTSQKLSEYSGELLIKIGSKN